MAREIKIKERVDSYLAKHPEVLDSKEAKIKIANWIPCIGGTWEFVKKNYPEYYYAKYPNERK